MADATREADTFSSSSPERFTWTGAEHARLAEAVAQLLHPTIVAVVEQALKQGLADIRKDLSSHSQQLVAEEECISVWMNSSKHRRSSLLWHKVMKDKIDDLQIRSQRNNLRIVGHPESCKYC